MKKLLVLAFCLVACGRNAENSSAATTTLTALDGCTYQGETPVRGGNLQTYYCPQYSPPCTYEILSGIPFEQVPQIYGGTCPAQIAHGQVP